MSPLCGGNQAQPQTQPPQRRSGLLLFQDPTVCQTHNNQDTSNPYGLFRTPQKVLYSNQAARCRSKGCFIDIPPLSNPPRNNRSRNGLFSSHHQRPTMRCVLWCLVLLRKEVIQPHLPVRLPCYDLVPIASPTFDSSLPTRGLGHRLRVLPTFVT